MHQSLADIEIRKADLHDIPALCSLLKLLFSIEEDFHFDEQSQQQGLKLIIESNSSCILVAELKGRVIGMCSGQQTISTAEGGPALLVEDVVVVKEWQGKGVGTLLMNNLNNWAKKLGIKRMQLLADKVNSSALQFYQKIGWQSTQLICLRKYTD